MVGPIGPQGWLERSINRARTWGQPEIVWRREKTCQHCPAPPLSHLSLDERVDRRLIAYRQLLELHAHTDLAIAPGDAAAGFDVGARAREPEANLNRRACRQGIHRPNRDAAL